MKPYLLKTFKFIQMIFRYQDRAGIVALVIRWFCHIRFPALREQSDCTTENKCHYDIYILNFQHYGLWILES